MDYFDFLNESVSPWHTVDCLRRLFAAAGFEERQMTDRAAFAPGKAYVFVRGGALVALRMPLQVNESSRFRLALAHTDFPALKISPNPDRTAAGACTLHAEVYGSPIYSTWLDRDLGYAGVLAYEKDGNVQTKLVRGSKLFRIPNLAVHLNRGVNQDGTKVDPQADFNALWQAATADGKASAFADALQGELGVAGRLLDFDIQRAAGIFWRLQRRVDLFGQARQSGQLPCCGESFGQRGDTRQCFLRGVFLQQRRNRQRDARRCLRELLTQRAGNRVERRMCGIGFACSIWQ